VVTVRLPLRGRLRSIGQHRPGLLTDDENTRLAEAAWAVYALGANTVVVEDLLASGASSRVWRLAGYGPGGCTHYVVKWFRPRARQAGRAVATEYAALTRLGSALAAVPPGPYAVGCPAPVQVWDWGYAMTAAPGVPLDRAVARGLMPPAAPARDLIAALRAYHAAEGAPHGDVDPGSVLLAPGVLCLLAPSAAPPPGPPMAVDLAQWVVGAAVSVLRLAPRHPRRIATLRALTADLARAAETYQPGLTAEIERCLSRRWDRLRGQGPQGRAVAAAATRLLRLPPPTIPPAAPPYALPAGPPSTPANPTD
jgi:hypothetical protein